MATGRERRRSERYPTASIPVQLSEINAELIDLSLTGAAVIHRSPLKSAGAATMIFPSYGGIYIPCQVLRSIVQVRHAEAGDEYVFRSAILFNAIPEEQEVSLREFIEIQIGRLEAEKQAVAESADRFDELSADDEPA